jgi:hypothetical protein
LAIKVINRHDVTAVKTGIGVYIGRPSPLGNPYSFNGFTSETCGSRKEAIDLFEKYLLEKIKEKDEKICEELNRLYRIAKAGDLTLVCSCKPLACHGDVIKKILENKIECKKA